MQLVEYGSCQVVRLMNVFRPQGAIYLPEVLANIMSKYQFAKPPSLDDVRKDAVKFQIGKFGDTQIEEFGVYGDGMSASGKCPTEALEAFLADVFSFGLKEIGYVPILEHRNEIHFESTITVKSEKDLAAFLSRPAETLIRKTLKEKIDIDYQSSGLVMDCDAASLKLRRKPLRVFIERKLGFPFGENLFLCIAPLRTSEHLELLTALEREAPK